MVASLVRLLHSGIQDERLLTLNPSVYIRVLIRTGRMTTQWVRLDFQQVPTFGQTASCRLLKKGELITRLYLVATMPDIYTQQKEVLNISNFVGPRFGWTNSLGHSLIQEANVTIGGNEIDTLDRRLLEVMDEFNTPLEKVINVNTMIGRVQDGFTETSLGHSTTPTQVIVPLPFWFSRGDLGAALPIDSLHVDEVRVAIDFSPLQSLYYTESRSLNGIAGSDGSGLMPILGSRFYYSDPNGTVVPGLSYTGKVSPLTSPIMPNNLVLGETYLLAEYVYLDKPEANRFRIADIEIPIVQHVALDVKDTQRAFFYQIPFEIQNPTRHLYFMAQNYYASTYNEFFLATADLSGGGNLWWPDCKGLNGAYPAALKPGFVSRGSEPFNLIELVYEGSYVRTSTENCALYRSILPSFEERKSPWINRYMYCLPFGVQSGYSEPSIVNGEANMNRINKKELRLGINGGQKWIYVWAETYNVLKIYGGRATLLFAY
jgi:hypothetical protein